MSDTQAINLIHSQWSGAPGKVAHSPPLQFALAMEPLALLIRAVTNICGRKLGHHHKCRLFANDTLLFISSPSSLPPIYFIASISLVDFQIFALIVSLPFTLLDQLKQSSLFLGPLPTSPTLE